MYENTPELIEKAKKGDTEAREKIIEQNLGLVHSIVRKFSNRGYEAEDLFQNFHIQKCGDPGEDRRRAASGQNRRQDAFYRQISLL